MRSAANKFTRAVVLADVPAARVAAAVGVVEESVAEAEEAEAVEEEVVVVVVEVAVPSTAMKLSPHKDFVIFSALQYQLVLDRSLYESCCTVRMLLS